jgi:phage baseplate assembly protein W
VNEQIIGRGMAFPVKPSPAGSLDMAGGGDKIRQSVAIILGTAAGERQMRPDFGCGIHDLVFQANTALLRNAVQDKVKRALTRWEPRIDVLDVRAETQADTRNYLLIRIDYRIRANNAFYNLVYPFFINEGNQQ